VAGAIVIPGPGAAGAPAGSPLVMDNGLERGAIGYVSNLVIVMANLAQITGIYTFLLFRRDAAWSYRHELRTSTRNLLVPEILPFVGGLLLLGVLVMLATRPQHRAFFDPRTEVADPALLAERTA
jgi:hypothetical protein